MRSRFFLSAASFLSISILAVSCATGPKQQDGAPAPETSASVSASASSITVKSTPDDFGANDTDRPQVFEAQTKSSWDPFFHASYPSAKGHTVFNREIEQLVDSYQRDYQAAYPSSGGEDATAAPEFTLSWSSLLSHDKFVGVRLLTVESGGASHYSTSQTLYSSTDNDLIKGKDLIAQDKMSELVQAIREAVTQQGLKLAHDTSDPEVLFKDASFTTHGALQLNVPKGELASADAGSVLVTIESPDTWLDSAGKTVRKVSTDPQPSAANPSSASAPSSAQPSATSSASTGTQAAPGSAQEVSENPAEVDCTVEKCIALTFDDGPGKYTTQIVDVFKKHKAKATFFMLGRSVAADPDTARYVHDSGMAIGNHTWSHPVLSGLAPATVKSELDKTSQAIKDATGVAPSGVRPPYGAFAATTPHENMPFILWNVDSEDWKNRDVTITTQRVLSDARAGAIVLMHDIHPSTAQAIEGIVVQLKKEGYRLVTVPELLGNDVDPQGAYYSGLK